MEGMASVLGPQELYVHINVSWLQADEKNLAAIHCLTGKGRTGTVIACYLAWVGRFPNAMESLEYVAEQRQTSMEKLTIPSQRRYIQYFNNVMDGRAVAVIGTQCVGPYYVAPHRCL